LLFGGIAIGVALGGVPPLPYGPAAAVTAYIRAQPVAVRVIATATFASSVPLAIYAATASARLRGAGLTAPGATIALAGGTAALFVLYRMLALPAGQTDLVSLSLSWGVWLALLGAAAIVAGGLLSGSGQRRRRPASSYVQQI